MKLKYLGHSAFELNIDERKILIDPFLVLSPDYDPTGVTDIFVTHAHSDHIGSAIEISKKTGAKITAIFELANYCASKGASAQGINLGGWIQYDWGKVLAVPAFHSSITPDNTYGGCPCGFIFNINDRIIYHAGDTCLNSEMKTIGEVYQPDLSMLPVGGYYTMDIEQAVTASEWLQTSIVAPMHYNTFDAIKVDISEFEREIRKLNKIPLIMNVGQDVEG